MPSKKLKKEVITKVGKPYEIFKAIVSHYCHYNKVVPIIRAKIELNEARKRLLKESCFGHLVTDVEQIEICDQLVNSLLCMQIPIAQKSDLQQPMKFKFGEKVIEFGNIQFAIMAGLRLGDVKEAIDGLSSFDPKSPPKILKYINQNNIIPRYSKIQTVFEGLTKDTPDDIVVSIALLMIAMQFVPKEGTSRVEPWMLVLLDDLKKWNEFPWGQYAYAQTVRYGRNTIERVRKRQHDKSTKKYKLGGFPLAFQVFLCEVLPSTEISTFFTRCSNEKHVGRITSWKLAIPKSLVVQKKINTIAPFNGKDCSFNTIVATKWEKSRFNLGDVDVADTDSNEEHHYTYELREHYHLDWKTTKDEDVSPSDKLDTGSKAESDTRDKVPKGSKAEIDTPDIEHLLLDCFGRLEKKMDDMAINFGKRLDCIELEVRSIKRQKNAKEIEVDPSAQVQHGDAPKKDEFGSREEKDDINPLAQGEDSFVDLTDSQLVQPIVLEESLFTPSDAQPIVLEDSPLKKIEAKNKRCYTKRSKLEKWPTLSMPPLEHIKVSCENSELYAEFSNWLEGDTVLMPFGCGTIDPEFMKLFVTPDLWLNGEHINTYIYMISRRMSPNSGKNIMFLDSYFTQQLENLHNLGAVEMTDKAVIKRYNNKLRWGCNMLEADEVYFPVNVGNCHWIAVRLDLQEEKIYAYNSMYDNRIAFKLEFLVQLLPLLFKHQQYHILKNTGKPDKARWALEWVTNTPNQGVSGDCGVFTLKWIELLAHNLSIFAINEHNSSKFRKKMGIDLFEFAKVEHEMNQSNDNVLFK